MVSVCKVPDQVAEGGSCICESALSLAAALFILSGIPHISNALLNLIIQRKDLCTRMRQVEQSFRLQPVAEMI